MHLPDELWMDILGRAANCPATFSTCTRFQRLTAACSAVQAVRLSTAARSVLDPRHGLVFEAATWLCIDSSSTLEPVTWEGSQLARAFPKASTIIVRCKPSDQLIDLVPGPLVRALRLQGTLQQVLPCLEPCRSSRLQHLGLEIEGDSIDLTGVLAPFAYLETARFAVPGSLVLPAWPRGAGLPLKIVARCGALHFREGGAAAGLCSSDRALRHLDLECDSHGDASVLDFVSQHMEAGEMRHLRLAGGVVAPQQLLSWQRASKCKHHVECCIEQGGITPDMLQQLLLFGKASYTLRSWVPRPAGPGALSPDDVEFLVDCHVTGLALHVAAAAACGGLVYRVLPGGWYELCLKALG